MIRTKRLLIRRAKIEDAEFYVRLWNNPKVMCMVGFPEGLNQSIQEVKALIQKQKKGMFDVLLVVEFLEKKCIIGEAKLGFPNENGVATTDVKILPAYWGNKLGVEIKQALVDYIFCHTSANCVEASPHEKNKASQKMQESIGAQYLHRGIYHFPPNQRVKTVDVPYRIYQISRQIWQKQKKERN